MQFSRTALISLAFLLVFTNPGWTSDSNVSDSAGRNAPSMRHENKVLHSAVDAAVPVLNVNTPTEVNAPLLSVQDFHQNTRQRFGLLGMYALCADNARIPYYITNVFPPSELNQHGVESGDLLTRINGVSPFDYMHSVHPTKPGDAVIFTFEHHGIPKTVSAKLQNIQTFTPFLGSYSQWATSHISFLKEHHGQYQSCGLF